MFSSIIVTFIIVIKIVLNVILTLNVLRAGHYCLKAEVRLHAKQCSTPLKKEIDMYVLHVSPTYHAAGCCDTRVASLSSTAT